VFEIGFKFYKFLIVDKLFDPTSFKPETFSDKLANIL